MLCLMSMFLLVCSTNCYVLLTANVDDMQQVIKDIASSTLGEQFKDILRRASKIFHDEVQRRTDDAVAEKIQPDQSPRDDNSEMEEGTLTRRAISDVVKQGKETTHRLKEMNKLIVALDV